MPAADVNGTRLRYDVVGAGPPLLMLMGYRLSADAWPPRFVDHLARRHRLILFDNRGTGRSAKPAHGYAIENLAADATALLDHLGVQRAAVLGYSMGGCIAQELALARPERMAALILCATLCGRSRSVYASPPVVQRLRHLDGRSAEEVARSLWPLTYAPWYLARHGGSAEAQLRREIRHPTPLYVADLQFQALTRFDACARLGAIDCPVLVLAGTDDRLVPAENACLLAEHLPDARLSLLPHHGHRVLWEAPDETAALIASFLAATFEAAHV